MVKYFMLRIGWTFLIAWCKQRAAGYKAPTSVDFHEALARTATGKLQKFKLRAPFWEGRERQVN